MAGALIGRLLSACAALWLGVACAADALPDPTRPPAAAPVAPAPGAGSVQAEPDSYTVQSIVYGPSRRLAVINGREVREGSTLGEARVVQIQRDVVILEIQGQRRPMPMYASVVQKPSASAVRPAASTGVKNHE